MKYDNKDFLDYLNAHNFDYVESDLGRVKKIGWFVFAELCMEDNSNRFDVVLFDTRNSFRDYLIRLVPFARPEELATIKKTQPNLYKTAMLYNQRRF